jgi:hypothetical protein
MASVIERGGGLSTRTPAPIDVIDALGVGLWAHHMLHGPRAVSPDLFSQALALMIEGVVSRAGGATRARVAT